jgi:hypothetical protein
MNLSVSSMISAWQQQQQQQRWKDENLMQK